MRQHQGELWLSREEIAQVFGADTAAWAVAHVPPQDVLEGEYYKLAAFARRARPASPYQLLNVSVPMTVVTIKEVVRLATHTHLTFEEALRDVIITGLEMKSRELDDIEFKL